MKPQKKAINLAGRAAPLLLRKLTSRCQCWVNEPGGGLRNARAVLQAAGPELELEQELVVLPAQSEEPARVVWIHSLAGRHLGACWWSGVGPTST